MTGLRELKRFVPGDRSWLNAARRARWRAIHTVRRRFSEIAIIKRYRCEREVRRFHAALEASPLAGHCWISAGFLLGWARERQMLAHDLDDVDLFYKSTDQLLVDAAHATLRSAGFEIMSRCRDITGAVSEVAYCGPAGLVQFDLIRTFESAPGTLSAYTFVEHDGTWWQLEATVPAQDLELVDHVGVSWLKPIDHTVELGVLYDTWQIPDLNYEAFNAPNVIDRQRLAYVPREVVDSRRFRARAQRDW